MRLAALLAFMALSVAPAWGASLLEGLWTPTQLAATPAEARQGRIAVADDSASARDEPRCHLPPLPEALRGVIRRVELPAGDRRVALTFDLCELADRTAGYDGAVVDLLRDANARATFFAGGKWMASHPERTLQLMADARFELGNHGWSHGNLGVLGLPAARSQVLHAQAQYEVLRQELARRAAAAGLAAAMDRVPQALALFRLPYGRCRPETLEMLAELGLACVQWSHVAEEQRLPEAPALRARRLAARLEPGDVVLLHANGVPGQTAAFLAALLGEMRNRGLVPATAGELLAAGTPRAVADGYFMRPGDNLGLDARYGDGTRHPRRTRD